MRRFLLLAVCLLSPGIAPAGVTIGLDIATLNELLPAVTLERIEIPVTDQRTLAVRIRDLRVTGLDPASGETGSILTSMRVEIPSLGMDATVRPELAVGVVEAAGESLLELSFRSAALPIPVLGSVDIGGWLPPLRFPTDSLFLMEGSEGPVPVRTRLSEVKMGREVLRFELDLVVAPEPDQ